MVLVTENIVTTYERTMKLHLKTNIFSQHRSGFYYRSFTSQYLFHMLKIGKYIDVFKSDVVIVFSFEGIFDCRFQVKKSYVTFLNALSFWI